MSINDEIKRLLESSKKTETVVQEETTEEIVEEIVELDEDISDEQIVEDLLALDELSKKTLFNYIQKASPQILQHGHHSGDNTDNGMKHFKKAQKRVNGVVRAASNLAGRTHNYAKKEQLELIGNILEELELEDITVDVSEDVNALLNGEETLTEEFKTKAATIFEAAVVTRVKGEVSRLEEEYQAKLEEQVESVKEGLTEKVDGYLNYIVEQWMSDNEIALTHGIKNEIMENFVSGIKSVFEQNYIEVPEEKFDVLESMETRLGELESKLNETTEKNVELTSRINEMRRSATISEACDGLTDIQVDKFKTLAEELSYEDEETFVEKLKTIRESYFNRKTPKQQQLRETFITDDPIEETKETFVNPAMSAYIHALNKK